MEENQIKLMVVIGGSAGSLEILMKLMAVAPSDAGAAYLIVLHRRNDADNILAELLSRKTRMPVREVEDKETIEPDTVYLAPPGYHVLIEDKQYFSLDASEKIHFSRPSIDVAFQSVAEVFANRTVGLLLSGANADGASGLMQIKLSGGIAAVQSPESAEVAYMPEQAIAMNSHTIILDLTSADGFREIVESQSGQL